MTLSDFIEANLDVLVDDWAEFASQLMGHGSPLTQQELQNSARHILERTAADMRLEQTNIQQREKSRGEMGGGATNVTNVAFAHADDRLDHGFTLDDVVAEFRALRAAIMRRWQHTAIDPLTALEETVRFNEAIDQVLTESIRRYSLRVRETRDRFTGILAHDLRSPLGAITNSSEFLLLDDSLSARCIKAVLTIKRSAARMKRMIDDLLDFARTRLGDTLPMNRTLQDAALLCTDACDEIRASYPQAEITLHLQGDLNGEYDGDRINQLLINLLVNAIQHGEGAITLTAVGELEQVVLKVANNGKPISKQAIAHIFDPLIRTRLPPEQRGIAANIGLGLYICRCTAQAHGGHISVESTEAGTVFEVALPRSSNDPA